MNDDHTYGPAHEGAEQFARRVLAYPEPVALGYLRSYHNSTCKCGIDGGPDGPEITLESMRRHWAGRL